VIGAVNHDVFCAVRLDTKKGKMFLESGCQVLLRRSFNHGSHPPRRVNSDTEPANLNHRRSQRGCKAATKQSTGGNRENGGEIWSSPCATLGWLCWRRRGNSHGWTRMSRSIAFEAMGRWKRNVCGGRTAAKGTLSN
jgi:hypothetical protein